MSWTRALLRLLTGGSFALGCAEPAASPTWHDDVAPIVAERCASCHSEGGLAGLSLDSYEAARDFAGLMAHATNARLMPPWAADTQACADAPAIRGDLRLTAAQIETLDQWASHGAPAGSPRPPPTPTPPLRLDADLDLGLRTPMQLEGHTDQLLCHIFDPQLGEGQWLRGLSVTPGSPTAIHHVNLFIETEAALGAGSAALDPDGDGWFGCFSWPASLIGYQAGSLLPGQDALVLPDDVGMLLPAGAKVIAQIHYEATGVPELDTDTKLHLQWADETPRYLGAVAVVGNQGAPLVDGTGLEPGPNDRGAVEFRIPASVADHVEKMRTVTPAGGSAHVWSLTNHMHYAGSGMRLEIERAQDGERSCWLDTPRWDFDWQRTYVLDGPVESMPLLHSGDSFVQTCTYDNTLGNARLAQALEDAGLPAQPRDILLGDTALDEMCLSFVGLAVEL